MIHENVFITTEEIHYYVNLINGEVKVTFDHDSKEGPFKLCETMVEADFYSLNILRQNIGEEKITTGTVSTFISRIFLGINQNLRTDIITKTMNIIEKKYPEYFL